MVNAEHFEILLDTCFFIAKRGLSPATAGNFSVRNDDRTMYISGSGKDKNNLTKNDFVHCDFNATLLSDNGKPSAETLLHGMIYQLSPETSCVLHTHSVATTVLSMLKEYQGKLSFHGYEMQKTIAGFTTHEETLTLYIFENSQDMTKLAHELKEMWQDVKKGHGFLVKGHGLYSWGNTIADAKRHMEGIEFLLACELTRRQIEHT
jgi:methylthioribulose-1-phosphate dehydratase